MDQREVTSPPSVEDDNALYFKDIDKGFNSIDRLNDDVFRYNGQDVLVQSTWELPIIIQYPNSKIKFEVSSNEGDIQFGIMFVAALEEDQPDEDMVTEVIDDMGIVETHIKPYTGEFTPRCEGVVFFVWDNSHDWWSNKNISYVIELYQPTFTAIDTERQHLSLNLLPDVISTYTEECIKAADMADHSEALMLKIPLIEKKIEQLQKQLDLHKTELASITTRAEASTKIIETLDSRVLGLCIR